MTDVLTEEEVQQTLQGYLTAATRTGALRGHRIEFTLDGTTWQEVLFNLAETEHPIAARATVYRHEWQVPTVVTELWAEVVPADESWRSLWQARPHPLFGAHVLRTALRRTFADVLGERREPDDLPTAGASPDAVEIADEYAKRIESTVVDWRGRVAAASTFEELNDVRREARAVRAMDLDLKKAIDERRAALEGRTGKPESAPKPTPKHRPRKSKPQQKAPVNPSVADAMRDALARAESARS